MFTLFKDGSRPYANVFGQPQERAEETNRRLSEKTRRRGIREKFVCPVKNLLLQRHFDAPAVDVGRYMAAVGRFLETNDPGHLAPFEGLSVTDVSGRTHPLETRPNMLDRLDQARGAPFEQVYRIVV